MELISSFQSTDNDKTASATWGKLACEILLMNWEGALEEINKVKDMIEQKVEMAQTLEFMIIY